MIDDLVKALFADKSCVADAIQEKLIAGEIEAIILDKSNRRHPPRMTERSVAVAISS